MNENPHKLIRIALFFLILACPCSLLVFPVKITTLLITALVILWFILSLYYKAYFKFRANNVLVFLPFVYYSLMVVGMIYTDSQHEGFKTLETKVPLIIFPVIFFTGYDILKGIETRRILVTYALFITVISIVIIGITIFSVKFLGQPGYSFSDLSRRTISIHPGYYSLYVGFSGLIFIRYFETFTNREKIIAAFLIIFLLGFNLLLVARMPLFAFIVCAFVYSIFIKKFKLLAILTLTVAGFLFLVGIQNPDWEERIFRPFMLIVEGDLTGVENFLFNRIQEFNCSMEILTRGTVVLTGEGTGDDNEALFQCYSDHKYEWVLSQRYNAHNQYIQSALQNGILGSVTFGLLALAPFLFRQVREHQMEFVLFSLLFALFSLTESTLEVQKGVVFFSFFYALFVSFAQKREEQCKTE